MFSRKKKSNYFSQTLSTDMFSQSKPVNLNRAYFLKKEKTKINTTSYYSSDTDNKLKQSANKYRSKSRSILDEDEEKNYENEKKDGNFADKLKDRASNFKKKILSFSRGHLNEDITNFDENKTNFKINYSAEQLDIADSDDQNENLNLKSESSKSAIFVKFFQKSESQPVSRKNSENEKNLSSSRLTRMSLPSKFSKLNSNLTDNVGKLEKSISFNWLEFFDQDLERFVKPNSVILWSGQKSVIESSLLSQMSKQEIELQERWFEIYTSEIFYFKSLVVLDKIILNAFKKNLKVQDFNLVLITNLKEIISLSKNLILAFDARLKNSLLIDTMFDIMRETMNDEKFQKIYIDYAGEKITQKENYDNLKKNNKKFEELMQKLNHNPILEGKDVQTFFIAPVQRLSRYKLLTDAILNILPEDSPHIEEGKNLSNLIKKILKKANKKAADTLNFSEAVKLFLLLKFQNNEIKLHQLFQNRELIYHNDLLSVKSLFFSRKEDFQNSLKRNKNAESKTEQFSLYHVILLTDLLFICKKQENQIGTFFYKVILKADKCQVDLEMCEWEEPNDEQYSLEENELDKPSKAYLLIFTIIKDTSTRSVNIMSNKKYIFITTKQEGEIWIKKFENDIPNFVSESDEEHNDN